MEKNGLPNPNFKGFMADSAQANWNAVRIVYGSGDPSVKMINRERTCLFHWATSMKQHTDRLIKRELQAQHIRLCRDYKDAKNLEEAESRYLQIKAWWYSSGAASEESLRELELWLAFWHFRYRQWGGFMETVSHSTMFLIFHAHQYRKLYYYFFGFHLKIYFCSLRNCLWMNWRISPHATCPKLSTTSGYRHQANVALTYMLQLATIGSEPSCK